MDERIRLFAQAGHVLPREAMEQAMANWQEAAPPLLDLLDAYADGRDRGEDAANAVFFILHMAGEMREKRAFAPLCRLMLDAEALDRAMGDGVTTTLARILIGTYDGKLGQLQAVIESEAADEFARAAALDALVWLTAAGAVPLADTTAYLRHLYAALRPVADFVWCGWQQAVAYLGLAELAPLAEHAFKRKLIDLSIMGYKDFRADLQAAQASEDRIAFLASHDIAPLDDAIAELSGWHGFSAAAAEEAAAFTPPGRLPDLGEAEWQEPVLNPFRHVGRNDPCPCGSGKKFKKCCLEAGRAA